jgi:hypothetical protein
MPATTSLALAACRALAITAFMCPAIIGARALVFCPALAPNRALSLSLSVIALRHRVNRRLRRVLQRGVCGSSSSSRTCSARAHL